MSRSHPTIYFVQETPPNGPVKIGFTGRRVKNRMAEGQTFVPKELIVLAEAYGTKEDEARLHHLFRFYRVRGEWFSYDAPIKELIDYLIFDEGSLQTWLEGMGV